MLPSHHCCWVYKGLWERPVPHHVEVQLLQKGPVIVRRAQSVGTNKLPLKKATKPQTQDTACLQLPAQ